jgi:hypothetical protein
MLNNKIIYFFKRILSFLKRIFKWQSISYPDEATAITAEVINRLKFRGDLVCECGHCGSIMGEIKHGCHSYSVNLFCKKCYKEKTIILDTI